MAEDVVFVEGQRRDAYYRNDPSKYGLVEICVVTSTGSIDNRVADVGLYYQRMRKLKTFVW